MKIYKTFLQEAGICYFIDMLNQNLTFENYKPSEKIKTSIPYNLVSKYLANNKDWYIAALEIANTILNNIDITNYIIHYRTEESSFIFKQGRILSNLQPNKWNTSDMFLIKKNYAIPEYTDIIKLNENLNKFDNIIGISLKKGVKKARLGNSTLNLYKRYTSHSVLNDNFKNFMKDSLKKLKNEKIYVKVLDLNFEKNFELIKNKKKSLNFIKSISCVLQFLIDFKNENQEELLYEFISRCLSNTPFSANYKRALGSTFEQVGNNPFSVKIDSILLKLNGENDLNFNITLNDSQKCRLQLRSVKNNPRFELLDTTLSLNGYKLMKDIQI